MERDPFKEYLRKLGFSATNDIFAKNAWYFRNALVRANYTNLQKGIYETTEYLEAFLRNLLLNERNELRNRNLHISGLLNEKKVNMEDVKVDIENTKVDIQKEKVDIESALSEKDYDFSGKTTVHIHRLFEKFGFDEQILVDVIDSPDLSIVCNINIGHAQPRCIIPFGVEATIDVDNQMIRFA